jgi:Ca2+:H+ antiporter
MSFFFGGLSRHEQYFNQAVASTAASLLALAVASVMIPTAYDYFNTSPEASIASISRGTAIIISVVYGFYLWFQLKTHPDMFNKENPRQVLRLDQTNSINRSPIGAGPLGVMSAEAPSLEGHWSPENWELGWQDGNEEQEDEPEEPQLHLFVACITLVSSVGIAILCAQFVVENIAMNAIALEFVGLILIPTVASTTKIITAVSLAVKDKMDLSLAVALESGLQISLLLIPALVWLGWILGNGNMTLSFDMFQVAVLVVAVFLVNTLIKNGRSHWVEGLLLQSLYL